MRQSEQRLRSLVEQSAAGIAQPAPEEAAAVAAAAVQRDDHRPDRQRLQAEDEAGSCSVITATGVENIIALRNIGQKFFAPLMERPEARADRT